MEDQAGGPSTQGRGNRSRRPPARGRSTGGHGSRDAHQQSHQGGPPPGLDRQWGHSAAPQQTQPTQVSSGESSPRLAGTVVSVKANYGFIRCHGDRRKQVFFHATALTGGPGVPQEGAPRPELQEMVRPGQQVEFSIQDSDGRLLAADVKVMEAPPQAQRLRGVVERALRGGQRKIEDSYGGRILWTPDAAAVAPSDGVSSPARQRPAGPNEAQQPAVAQSGPRAQEGSPAKGQAQAAQAHAGAAAAAARGAAGAPQQAQSSVPSPITREPGAGNAQERQPAQTDRRSLPFDGTDLLPGTPQLHPGDEVEFLLVHDRQTNEPKATQVQRVFNGREAQASPVKAAQPSTAGAQQREKGTVATLKDNYGFLTCADREARLFFHFSEARFSKASILEGAEVSFLAATGDADGRPIAKALQLLAPGTIAASYEQQLPEMVRGFVMKPAVEKRAAEVQDGILRYADENGVECFAAFGAHQVEESVGNLLEADEVEFGVTVNLRSGARKARSISLLARSTDRRELGKVALLKNNFGTIARCERALDIFFHFDNLEGCTSSDLALGDDVEFSVIRDDKSKKPAAVRVAKAAKGAAVFETVSELEYEGRVTARAQGKGVTATSGLLQFSDDAGLPATITFGPRDLQDVGVSPLEDEKVTFRIASNVRVRRGAEAAGGLAAIHSGRRAVQVYPLVHTGTVVLVKQGFGFLETGPPGERSRLYFSLAEVPHGVHMAVGDEVEFIVGVNSKSGERLARMLKRTKEAPTAPPVEVVPERNPNAMKFTGNLKSGLKDSPAARAPRMPDGSAGFLPGPWCERRAAALEAEAEAERAKAAAAAAKEQKDAATAAAAAGGSKGMGARTGSGMLNPTARSFLPRSLSGGSDVFLTPAPSLVSASSILDLTADQVHAVQLQHRLPSDTFMTPAASLTTGDRALNPAQGPRQGVSSAELQEAILQAAQQAEGSLKSASEQSSLDPCGKTNGAVTSS